MSGKKGMVTEAIKEGIKSSNTELIRLKDGLHVLSNMEQNWGNRRKVKKVQRLIEKEKRKQLGLHKRLYKYLEKQSKKINKKQARNERLSLTEYRLIVIKDCGIKERKLKKSQFEQINNKREIITLQTAKGKAKIIDFDGHIEKNSHSKIKLTDDSRKQLARGKFLVETGSGISEYSVMITLAGALAGAGFATAMIWLIKMYVLGAL